MKKVLNIKTEISNPLIAVYEYCDLAGYDLLDLGYAIGIFTKGSKELNHKLADLNTLFFLAGINYMKKHNKDIKFKMEVFKEEKEKISYMG